MVLSYVYIVEVRDAWDLTCITTELPQALTKSLQFCTYNAEVLKRQIARCLAKIAENIIYNTGRQQALT
jgi:hypothetical protein